MGDEQVDLCTVDISGWICRGKATALSTIRQTLKLHALSSYTISLIHVLLAERNVESRWEGSTGSF